MKNSPFRLSSVLMPFAFALSFLAKDESNVLSVFIVYTSLLLISCAAPGSFRNASAAEPGLRRVESRFLGSVIIMLIVSLLIVGLSAFHIPNSCFTVVSTVSAASLLLEQLFEERLNAIGHPTDANLLALISSILFAAGAFLGRIMYGSVAGLLLAVLITAINQPVRFRKPLFSFGYTLRALLQDFVPPVVMLAAVHYLSAGPVFAAFGWMICRGCRTFARCSPDETRKPLFLVSLMTLTAAIVPLIFPSAIPAVAVSIASALCILIGFDLGIRSVLAGAFCAAAAVLSILGLFPFAVISALISAVISFDRRIFLRKV